MGLIVIVYLVIFLLERHYLKTNTRKKRTKWIVYGCMCVSFLYSAFAYFSYQRLSTPDRLLVQVIRPIQMLIVPE